MNQSALLAITPVGRHTTTSRISTSSHIPTLRSMTAMHALGNGSGYREDQHNASEAVTPGNQSGLVEAGSLRSLPDDELALSRDDTLLDMDASPVRNAAELKSLLGNSSSRLKSGAAVLPPPSLLPHKLTDTTNASVIVALEQAKPRVRVEVDIILESDFCIQGNYLKGRVKVHVCKGSKTEPPVCLAKGRVRIIGYECINGDERHTFYQCTAPLSTAATSTEALYTSAADEEGYAEVKEGVHVFPFAVWLPLDDSCGIARGVGKIQSGATVRYIAMA